MNRINCLAMFCVLFLAVAPCFSQDQEIPLWPNGAPGALGTAPKDIPTLTAFVAPNAPANAGSIVILPGGGYVNLAAHEGAGYANFFKARGLTTFVLKYRLGKDGYHHPAEWQDVSRAIRWVRAHAAEYKIDPNKVGVMGSSAGGHLASTIMTHFDAGDAKAADPIDKLSSRPDFGILCYAVITMGEKTHAGSKNALLGTTPSPELVAELSNELHVTKETPPAFIWAGLDDRTVPVQNTIDFAAAMQKAGVPCEVHILEHASHGLGLGDRNPPHVLLPWVADMTRWLTGHGITLLPPPATQPSAG